MQFYGNPYLNEKPFYFYLFWVMCLLESSSWDILDINFFPCVSRG
jgi:hypothetical protein